MFKHRHDTFADQRPLRIQFSRNAIRLSAALFGVWLLVALGSRGSAAPGSSGHRDTFSRLFGEGPSLVEFSPASVGRFSPEGNSTDEIDLPKNSGYAVLLSLALPGTGEYYVGSKKWARNFLVMEAALWGTYGLFKMYAGWLEQDLTAYAARHAGVIPAGKNDDYFVNIGNFDTIEEYNQYTMRQRNSRDLYPNTPEYRWVWDSRANRWRFRDIRIRRDAADHRALFTVGLVVANHIISAIDALRVARLHNRRLKKSQGGFGFHLGASPDDSALTLSIFLW